MVVVADVIVIVVVTVIETLLALLVYRFRIQSVTPCFGKRQREKVSEGNKKIRVGRNQREFGGLTMDGIEWKCLGTERQSQREGLGMEIGRIKRTCLLCVCCCIHYTVRDTAQKF